ncbi:DUF3558 domain-containing protein [Nocardia vulneris]|uniref:DUF3558 domain-containing protein n=1 Tax=Nocardia vulneris TaxID=1141657 RepID=UPI0030D0C7B2
MRTASVSRVAIRTVLVGAAVTALVTGCSPTKDGTPTTSSGKPANGEQKVFNPCTELSDEALRATKADPASKHVVTDAPSGGVVARICKWTSTEGPYFVTVSSTSYTLDDVRKNTEAVVLGDVKVGPRSGLISGSKGDADKLECYVSLPAAQGTVDVSVGWRYSERSSMPEAPPCRLAVRHATDLEPYLPK